MRLRPLIAALVFSIANVPNLVRSQAFFDGSGRSPSVATDFDYANFSYSLADMGGIQTGGSMSYPGIGQISWAPGTRPEDLFTVGMLSDFGFQNLSLDQIGSVTGQPVSSGSLASFPLVQQFTVSQLVEAIPELSDLPLEQVPPFAAMAQQQGLYGGGSGGTVGGLASAIQGPVGQLGGQLVRYGISQIPGLPNLSLSKLPGIDLAKIADIPGLSQFPLFNPISIKDWFVPFDIGFGMSPCSVTADCHERNIDNTASGNEKNMAIPCMGENQSCAHIEVRRNIGNPTQNIRWISKEQLVPGGSGLGAAICGMEPTGRFPLGKNPKVVLEKIDEAAGEIEFALYFSITIPIDGSETAHCFGPFPMPVFGSAKEGQWILFGPDAIPKDSPFASLGAGGPGGSSSSSGGDGDSGLCVASSGKTASTYKGIDIAAFKNAISNVESRGSGGYSAIGVWVDDGAGNQGRGLGKYQFMSYGPAKAIIAAKPGGQAFLNAVNSPSINTSAIGAQLPQFLTAQEQESLMDNQIRRLVDVGTAQGLTGNALIRRMAEMHVGGEGAPNGVDNKYSDSVSSSYKNGGCVAGSGISTGKLRFPVSAPMTDGYLTDSNNWRGRPHRAIDFGAPTGTPIHAADGGVVTVAGWDDLCGNMVVIDHKNGFTTTYCHMSQINTATGTPVSSGQVIGLVGTTGRSTGPHLHFALKKNGQPVNPLLYLGK